MSLGAVTRACQGPAVRRLAGLVALFAMVLAAYHPVLSAGFIWDDDSYVTFNTLLKTAGGLRRIWLDPTASPQYYPLVFTTFWLEYQAWKLWPVGYHLVNICLHALNAVLAWRVLRRLGLPGAWWAAAIFALHPVQVESVAWITELKNVLSGCWFLLACWSYLRYDELRHDPSPASHRRWRYYGLALVSFAAALLSKTVTCTLPAVLAIMLAWRHRRLSRRDLLPLLPLLLLGAAMAAMTTWLETVHVGAGKEAWRFSAAERLLIAGRAFWFYLGKLLWPARLTFIYPRWSLDPTSLLQWSFPLAALVVFAGGWTCRRRLGRGPPLALTAFVVLLSPALGFVSFYPMLFSFVADHFQYLAGLAPIALVVGTTATAVSRGGRLARVTATIVAVAVAAALGLVTWQQGQIYRSPEALWRDTLRNNPGAWIAHNNLAVDLFLRGAIEESEVHAREALRLKPDCAEAYNSLGNVFMRQGHIDAAIAAYTKALAFREDFTQAYRNVGHALIRREQQQP